MALIVSKDDLGFKIFESMFKNRNPKKAIIIKCHKVFKKMVPIEGINYIPLTVLCFEVQETHWDVRFDSIKGLNKIGITYPKYSVDVEVFNLSREIL